MALMQNDIKLLLSRLLFTRLGGESYYVMSRMSVTDVQIEVYDSLNERSDNDFNPPLRI